MEGTNNMSEITATRSGLFARVSLLLTLSLGLSALGTYLGRNIDGAVFIVTLVAFIAGTFIVPFVARKSEQGGLIALAVWVFISGLFISPAIHSYAHQLGWQTVTLAYIGSGGIMAVCGLIGAFSGRDFSGMGRTLMISLFALIIVGFVGIFVQLGQSGNIVYSIAGMVVFAGFFIFDFFRLSKSSNTTYNAVTLTMSLYLDFINFLLFFLRLLGSSSSNSSKK